MSPAPATALPRRAAQQQCIARAERIVKVKFVGFPGLPAESDAAAAVALRGPRFSPLSLPTRVLGRLWAARP